MRRTSPALLVSAPPAILVFLGLFAWRRDVEVAEPLNLVSLAPDPSPFRTLTWWLFAAAVSCALTLLALLFLFLRRRLSTAFARAISDVCLLFAFLFSGPLVDGFVQSTRSRTGFECILPGFLLLWGPAVLAFIAAVIYRVSYRPHPRTPRVAAGVA